MTTSRFAPRIPSSTYRLQFHAAFTFQDAIGILDYLAELGITEVYASPFFQAGENSTHGYDVADPNRISPAIGGREGFEQFSDALRARGMGLILDFVPNHMGIGESVNRWWVSVLEEGPASEYARYFDIDWHPAKSALAEKVILPVLGDRYGVELERGMLQLEWMEGAIRLKCYDSHLPIDWRGWPEILQAVPDALPSEKANALRDCLARFENADDKTACKAALRTLAESDPEIEHAVRGAVERYQGTPGEPASFDALHAVLEKQAYRLSYWRVAAEELNYRRFFDVTTLAALRVELPEVFEASHRLVTDLMREDRISGLRIDHVDGLWNPKEYLDRLQRVYSEAREGAVCDDKPLYLLVEKILDPSEESLPDDWPVHGTTGYEFANQVVHALTDRRAERRLTTTYTRFTGETGRFADLVYAKKRLMIETSFAAEFATLARMLDELSEADRYRRDFTHNMLARALREVAACFPVYRTYCAPDHSPTSEEQRFVLRAVSSARRRNPTVEKPVFDFLRDVLLLRYPDHLPESEREGWVRFVMRFQQCSGPVMAKGFEDTALYLYHRLTALNEVGGNPGQFGLRARDFHRLNSDRMKSHPHAMLSTSTHDTKRSEDVRMRMVAISEMPGDWGRAVTRWSRINRKFRTRIEEEWAPSPNEEYLLYQTLLGAWPLEPMDDTVRTEFTGRIREYMMKALKEGKANSSWTEPQEDWEQAVGTYIDRILDPADGADFLHDFQPFADRIARCGLWNSLAQVVLKCTSPGAPDFYQGTEAWDLSLVDPDNRRPVDYARRMDLLRSDSSESIDQLLADWKSGGIKLHLIRQLLTFRRDHAEFFREARYQALSVRGERKESALAFQRLRGESQIVVVTARFTSQLGEQPVGSPAWGDTEVVLPALGPVRAWRDILTGRTLEQNSTSLRLAEILHDLPVAVLVRGFV